MTKIKTAASILPGSPVSKAIFSDDMRYRYVLERVWDERFGRCVFIGLNPSTADENKNDPTVARCIAYAKAWGYGAFVMLNAFAFRSTDPAGLLSVDDPVGAENDAWIASEVARASIVVAAWGVHASIGNRHGKLVKDFPALACLGTTKAGFPKHPLYLRKDARPVPFEVQKT
jgi:hypothetical protein